MILLIDCDMRKPACHKILEVNWHGDGTADVATGRTPLESAEFAKNAKKNGFGAIICAAGMAAHLAGAIAANTVLPVIGIPVKSKNLDGMDALLATVQMPTGIPVATVAIDGAANAALLAIQMIAISDEALYEKLVDARVKGAEGVLEKNKEIEEKYNV